MGVHTDIIRLDIWVLLGRDQNEKARGQSEDSGRLHGAFLVRELGI